MILAPISVKTIFDSDKHSELRILDWIFYQVCINHLVSFSIESLRLVTESVLVFKSR